MAGAHVVKAHVASAHMVKAHLARAQVAATQLSGALVATVQLVSVLYIIGGEHLKIRAQVAGPCGRPKWALLLRGYPYSFL